MNYILVIIIDDDTKDNIKSLYETYSPLSGESILIFSPVRNIASWFHYIETGNSEIENKDEQGRITDYKSQYKNSKPTKFAKKLKNEICTNGLQANAPASLRCACDELNRLKN